MTTLKDIDKAITQLITKQFPSIDIQESDVEEGFPRPSFFITYDNIGSEDYLYVKEQQLTVRIFYFPSDQYAYQLEVMDMIEQLNSLFSLNFSVGDRVFTIESKDSQIVDKVLEFEFDFTYHTASTTVDGSNKEKMKELMMNVRSE